MSKKVGLLKGIGALCSVILLSGSITFPAVFASESMCTADIGTESEAAVYTGGEFSAEMDEFCTHMMFGDTLQEGEERVLGILDGEEFCVRVTDVTESSPSAYAATSTTSKEFTFYTKNALGVKKDVLKVTSKCTWIKGSKIVNLECTYTKLVSNISCSWNDNYKKATDLLHTLGLDITYDGKSGIVFFGASLSLDKQTLTLDCSEDYEL